MAHEKVLLAEDESDVRDMCVRTLEMAGYQVVAVRDGQEAVEYASREQFDLLLTDLKMPKMNGLEACRAIRATQPDLPTIVMTGYGTLESAIEALQLGVSEFVLKPFRPQVLHDAVDRALLKQRLQRENARLKALIPLFELSRVFMSPADLNVIPQHVVRIAQSELRADSASVMLLNGNNELTIHSAVGLPPDVVANTRQRADQGIAGYAIKHREPVILQGDVRRDPRFQSLERGEKVQSAICLPLIRQDNVLGVLNVSRTEEGTPFTEGDVELLSVLGSQAAIALDNARLFREIEQAYQRLAELDYLKSEFINIAAHELRSPLAVILAYAAILEDEATGPIREHLIQVVEAAMQLKSIIDDMVSLRQIDTGEAQVKLADVNVVEVIQEVLNNTSLLAKRKGQRITVDAPDTLPAARADAEILYLILSSLISNAVKFTPEGGSIHIAAVSEEDRVVIRVCDTGIGIPEDELENIFQRFYQVADSLRREYGGIGLGLAIAREMANLINARIWAKSQVGQGSTFYLSLPQA